MEAGKELDGLIATKVMGHEYFDDGVWVHTGHSREFAAIPPYSTDIMAAWLVVEKMTEPFNLARDDEAEWWARFGYSNAYAKTAPLAICLAALKTLENEGH